MCRSSSWETDSFSAAQRITHILWNPTVHTPSALQDNLHVSQINPVRDVPFYFFKKYKYLLLFSHLCLSLSSGLFTSGFFIISRLPHKWRMPLPFYPLPFDHLIIFHEEYTSWSSSSCSLLQFPLTPLPHPLSPVFLCLPFSSTFTNVLTLIWETKFHTQTKTTGKNYSLIYFKSFPLETLYPELFYLQFLRNVGNQL